MTNAITKRNRANAKKSSGPRTPAGKERSSMNAVKHGATSNSLSIRGESSQEAGELVESCRRDLSLPSGGLGSELARSLAVVLRREKRLAAFEEASVEQAMAETEDMSKYPETAEIDRLTKQLETIEKMVKLTGDPEWQRTPCSVEVAETLLSHVQAAVDAGPRNPEAPNPALEEMANAASQLHLARLHNEPPAGFTVTIAEAVHLHRGYLVETIEALRSRRSAKIEHAKRLASIPDDATVRRIGRYRSEIEGSLLRKLKIVSEIRNLAANDSTGE